MLGRIWNWLFRSCQHEWDIYQEGNILFEGRYIGKWYNLRCKKCGDMKRRELTT